MLEKVALRLSFTEKLSHVVGAGRDKFIDLTGVASSTVANIARNDSFCISQAWHLIYDAASLSHTWDQWLAIDYVMHMAAVPYLGMVPVAHHRYVDGSFFRQQALAGWAVVIVIEDAMGSFCLLGFMADYLSEQHACQFGANVVDNMFAEAVSIFHAVSWLLTQPHLCSPLAIN